MMVKFWLDVRWDDTHSVWLFSDSMFSSGRGEKKCDKKSASMYFVQFFRVIHKKNREKIWCFFAHITGACVGGKKYIEKCKSEGGVEITRKKSHEGWGWTRDSGWAAHRQLVPRPGGKNSFVSLDSPPLRSHTTRTVANVICFIHRPCVCVRIGKKLIRWMEQKKCFVMLWTLPSSPAFTFFTVSRWMQLIFHIFKRLSTSSTPSRLLEKRLFVLPRRCLVEYLPQPFAILRSAGLRENLNVFMWKFNYAKKSH